MKLGIVIPLKSKCVSKDWSITVENLKMTVDSVLAQTSNNYFSVVVGHDKPDFFAEEKYKNEICSFRNYDDFKPPVPGVDEPENQLKYEFDRCTKILRGIMWLKSEHPDITHWFSLDADDLIRKDFVKVIEEHGQSDVIILEHGFFYFKNTGIVNKEDEFSAYCGSSSVISDHVFDLPTKVDSLSYRTTPFGNISHVHMRKRMIEQKWKVSVPKQRVIMYVRDNGENISNNAYCNTPFKKFKKFVKMFLRYSFIGGLEKKAFGI